MGKSSRPCAIKGCVRTVNAKGLCEPHRRSQRLYGDPLKLKLPRNGARKSPIYHVWISMRQRCLDPTYRDYPNYGGRGITICPEWSASFTAFETDMGKRPEGYLLDRINNEGNYEPSNCRWASPAVSARNTRNNKRQGTSVYRGVIYSKAQRTWIAAIGVDNTRVHLGNFGSEEDAALAYDCAAIQLHGEGAKTNLIDKELL